MKTCNDYQQYEQGKMAPEKWRQHLDICSCCRTALKQDQELLRQAGALRRPVTAANLWDRIETSLQTENAVRIWSRKKSYRWLRLAAMLALAVIGGYWWGVHQAKDGTGLLADSALQRVQKQELNYEQAIADLEKKAQPHMQTIDKNLAELYRNRLRTIDEQIFRCKMALAANPANTHIRTYLLAAMKDKRQTLQQLMEVDAV